MRKATLSLPGDMRETFVKDWIRPVFCLKDQKTFSLITGNEPKLCM